MIATLAVTATTSPAEAGHRKHAYTPRSGVLFNNPIGPRNRKWVIFNQIVGAIQHTPKHGEIRVMSWNILSRHAVDALIAASRRGVRVRVIMDLTNRTMLPNPGFTRLQRQLRSTSARRPASRRSAARTCRGSCRGHGGQAHSKYFLFSRVGTKRHVVMEGSANLTAAAAINQWNDLFTWTEHRGIYDFYTHVFSQMWQDRARHNPYVTRSFRRGDFEIIFFPFTGSRATADPVTSRLRRVHCWGAAPRYGEHGRTIVRASPDVIRGRRGMRIAVQLKKLYNQGCDVKMIYTVMGRDIHRYLFAHTGRGPLPTRHLVQDFDGDGEFDNYFHLKAMTVNGNYGKDRSTRFVLQGSSNWSAYAAVSDENIAVIHNTRKTLLYQRELTYWFDHAPPMYSTSYARSAARRAHVDPYAHVDMD